MSTNHTKQELERMASILAANGWKVTKPERPREKPAGAWVSNCDGQRAKWVPYEEEAPPDPNDKSDFRNRW
jgi:hypothetical protein